MYVGSINDQKLREGGVDENVPRRCIMRRLGHLDDDERPPPRQGWRGVKEVGAQARKWQCKDRALKFFFFLLIKTTLMRAKF